MFCYDYKFIVISTNLDFIYLTALGVGHEGVI